MIVGNVEICAVFAVVCFKRDLVGYFRAVGLVNMVDTFQQQVSLVFGGTGPGVESTCTVSFVGIFPFELAGGINDQVTFCGRL